MGLRATGPGRLKLWNVATGSVKYDLSGHNHVTAVAFSPDGRLLASGGSWISKEDAWEDGVQLWSVRGGADSQFSIQCERRYSLDRVFAG